MYVALLSTLKGPILKSTLHYFVKPYVTQWGEICCDGAFLYSSKLFLHYRVKVSKFQNEFMKSSFLSKFEPKIVRISFIFWEKR